MTELWPGGPITLPHQIEFQGQLFTVPAMPNTALMSLVAGGEWFDLFPRAVEEHQARDELFARLLDDDDDLETHHIYLIAAPLIGAVTGMSMSGIDGYPAAVEVAKHVLDTWALFAAWCAARNLDALALPPYRLWPAGLAWMREEYATTDYLTELWDKMWGGLKMGEPPEVPEATSYRQAASEGQDESPQDEPVVVRRAPPPEPEPTEAELAEERALAQAELARMLPGDMDPSLLFEPGFTL